VYGFPHVATEFVSGAQAALQGNELSKSPTLVSQYMCFHYGSPADVLSYDFGPVSALEFPRRIAFECIEQAKVRLWSRSNDILVKLIVDLFVT
jgi:hypothetical protein